MKQTHNNCICTRNGQIVKIKYVFIIQTNCFAKGDGEFLNPKIPPFVCFWFPTSLMGVYLTNERNYRDSHARRLRTTFRRNSSVQAGVAWADTAGLCIFSFLKKFENHHLISKTIPKKDESAPRDILVYFAVQTVVFVATGVYNVQLGRSENVVHTHGRLVFLPLWVTSYDR